MARYADVEALAEKFKPGGCWYGEFLDTDEMVAFLESDDYVPTVDVAPVDHAQWELVKEYGIDSLYRCSKCHRKIRACPDELQEYPYCHCGAKMEVK